MVRCSLKIKQTQLVLGASSRLSTYGFEQIGCPVELLLGALQIPVAPQRQAEPVSDLGLVFATADLLGYLQTLLEIGDGLRSVTQRMVDTTCR